MQSQPVVERHEPPSTLTLSVVMPVFNEQAWVARSLAAVREAGRNAGLALDVVVVDDGSTDDTPAILRELAASAGIRVISRPNEGRFAARCTGVTAATGEWVLLLDSRVEIDARALAWLREQLTVHPGRRVWNGHVDVMTRGNMFAAFWSGLVKIGWRRYTAKPRLVSFGSDDFDLYPKGTGALVLPRALFLDAVGEFQSMFADHRLASDDTRLLRNVVARERIWIAPEFAFRYHGKAGVRGFLRQSFFRGTTFVDGYLGQRGAVRRSLIAAMIAALGLFAVLVMAPLLGLALLVAALLTPSLVVARVGGTWPEIRAVLVLFAVFVPVFGLGVLRGLVLALTRAVGSPARPA